MKPQARKEGLVVKELPDEMLVYDLKHHHAHCLNRTAALVYKHCNGKTSVGEMVGLFESELGKAADERVIWLALDQLGKAGLLEERLSAPPEVGRYSRREVVRRLGLGLAVLLPLVTSLVAPTPAEAGGSCAGWDCNGITDYTLCGDCLDDYCYAGACVFT